MREYQAGEYRSLPGLELWWRALSRALPDIARAAAREPKVAAALDRLLVALPGVLDAPTGALPAQDLHLVATALDHLSGVSVVQRAFARRASLVLSKIEGKSWSDAVRVVATVPPRGRRRSANRTAAAAQ